MDSQAPVDWDSLWRSVAALRRGIGQGKSRDINRAAPRTEAQMVVQGWFRNVRPFLPAGIDEARIDAMDGRMQTLLQLSNRPSARSSYKRVLGELNREAALIGLDRDRRMGEQRALGTVAPGRSLLETKVIVTLAKMVPNAALSYEQAVLDLETKRTSHRGTAVELREALRELLDYLAPDDAVKKSPGYTQEKNASGPTMVQKAKFILRSRAKSDSLTKPAIDAVKNLENATETFVRSTYSSGSVSVHVSPSQGDVRQLKLYVESALSELLSIYR
jgi:Predicted pPIWI-associating nuclease